jgi:hypothetical protein
MTKFGLKSANKKSVAETLDEITKFCGEAGTEFLNDDFYKVLVTLADDKDKSVMKGSLDLFAIDFHKIGEAVWDKITKAKATEKAKGLFE